MSDSKAGKSAMIQPVYHFLVGDIVRTLKQQLAQHPPTVSTIVKVLHHLHVFSGKKSRIMLNLYSMCSNQIFKNESVMFGKVAHIFISRMA